MSDTTVRVSARVAAAVDLYKRIKRAEARLDNMASELRVVISGFEGNDLDDYARLTWSE